jgi:hypothetical protein
VLAGRLGALWLGWLAVAQTALVLWWAQTLDAAPPTRALLFLALFAVNAAAVAAWEAQARRAVPWLAERWLPRVLVAAAFAAVAVPVLWLVFDGDRVGAPGPAAILIFAGACAACYGGQKVRPDLFRLAAAGGTAMVLVTAGVGRLVLHDDPFTWLFMVVLVVGEVALAAWWLRRQLRAGEG